MAIAMFHWRVVSGAWMENLFSSTMLMVME